jgi:hypothetical protein
MSGVAARFSCCLAWLQESGPAAVRFLLIRDISTQWAIAMGPKSS